MRASSSSDEIATARISRSDRSLNRLAMRGNGMGAGRQTLVREGESLLVSLHPLTKANGAFPEAVPHQRRGPPGLTVFWRISAISTNFRHNHQIRISPIFLIDQNDVKVGTISTSEALKRAQEAGMD